ncbi:HU family DNA-binding protein [Shimia ponticola]|uniref:HU family DNA-binding protein n=1 Tax=Shimia ponticola TaxID=2582893 RepID=UPI0011BDBB40|nr:HU family DNA-binding protein [Shimia ponticola]
MTAAKKVEASVATADLKKKDLIDQAVQRSGVKKAMAKAAIEAALAVMGEALERGEGLNIEPLGKVKIQRQKDVQGAKIITTRVRRKTAAPE